MEPTLGHYSGTSVLPLRRLSTTAMHQDPRVQERNRKGWWDSQAYPGLPAHVPTWHGMGSDTDPNPNPNPGGHYRGLLNQAYKQSVSRMVYQCVGRTVTSVPGPHRLLLFYILFYSCAVW